MLAKALNCLRGHAKPIPVTPVRSALVACPGGIARMISYAGRINPVILQRMVQAVSRDEFIHFMQAPALAGSAIHMGTLSSAQANSGPRELNRTVLFEPAEDTEQTTSPSESLKHAVYPMEKGEHAASPGNFFSIGRIDGNDCIMPDYAISKKHALIEFRKGIYRLKDSGSTNGTFLNGARLQTKPVEIHDQDVISFARYEFTFFFPESLYEALKAA
jgi:hypothetical protein